MRYGIIQLARRSFVLVVSIFLLGLSTTYAQIGELGIYGSAPEAYREYVRYVRLEDYPEEEGGLSYVLPVNGLTNFNFYYLPNGTGFLPTHSYKVIYLNASQTTSYGYDIVNYYPNSGHTNGVKVREFNDPPETPRGVHGVVYGIIDEVSYPIPNATVYAYPYFNSFSVQARTNDNGFFAIYNKNGTSAEFLPVYYGVTPPYEYYSLIVQGSVNGCFFSQTYNQEAYWEPANTTNPSNSSYFVTGAESDVGDLYPTLISCE